MIEKLLNRIARALRKEKIPYMLIGGQAVLFYGHPRLTHDVDVTLGVDVGAYDSIQSVCKEARLKIAVANPADFVRKTRVLPAKDRDSSFRVDFIFSNTPFERQAIQRARSVKIGGTLVKMVSLEDLIIHKLVAGRAVDIEDVRVLMEKRPKPNKIPYIRRWLKQFSVLGTLPADPLETFNRIRGEAGRR